MAAQRVQTDVEFKNKREIVLELSDVVLQGRSVKPKTSALLVAALAVGAVVAGGGGWWIYQRSFAGWERAKAMAALAPARPAEARAMRHTVQINPGPETPVVQARTVTMAGTPVAVACATCHATRTPRVELRATAELQEFHVGLRYQHGDLTCLSCHNAANYDTLRRADGTAVAYPQTMQLCAQCHGPHYRDYQHGSHGGMTGHWDLTRGPRVRNTCTDCHDPHAPRYPLVRPVFAPRDRGAEEQRERERRHAL